MSGGFSILMKKILISTDVRVGAGMAEITYAAVDLDPLLVGFGLG